MSSNGIKGYRKDADDTQANRTDREFQNKVSAMKARDPSLPAPICSVPVLWWVAGCEKKEEMPAIWFSVPSRQSTGWRKDRF